MIEPVVVEVNTKKSPQDAFSFFIEKMHLFWPMGHSVGETPRTAMMIEMQEGGRWYEVCGTQECDWGRVLDFIEGEHVRFAWHLNADWMFDPEKYSEVLVSFEASADGTVVKLVHSKLENFGENAAQVRASLASDTGWLDIMSGFEKAAA